MWRGGVLKALVSRQPQSGGGINNGHIRYPPPYGGTQKEKKRQPKTMFYWLVAWWSAESTGIKTAPKPMRKLIWSKDKVFFTEALSSIAWARNSLRAVECRTEPVFLAQLFLASDLDSSRRCAVVQGSAGISGEVNGESCGTRKCGNLW